MSEKPITLNRPGWFQSRILGIAAIMILWAAFSGLFLASAFGGNEVSWLFLVIWLGMIWWLASMYKAFHNLVVKTLSK